MTIFQWRTHLRNGDVDPKVLTMSGNEANSCYRGQPQHETRLPRGKRLPISQRLLFRRKDDLYKGVELRLFGVKSNTRTKKKKTSTPESWTHSHFNPPFFLLRPHWQKYKLNMISLR